MAYYSVGMEVKQKVVEIGGGDALGTPAHQVRLCSELSETTSHCHEGIRVYSKRTAPRGGRQDRLDALVAEMRANGIEVESYVINPFTQGDMFNIWVRWGNARLNLTSAASIRRHIERVSAVPA